MARFSIHPWAKVGSLKNATVLDLTAELSNMKIENDLRREVQGNIGRLRDMGTYRGRRHAMGLPVRGQRTRTQVGMAARLCDGMLTMVDYDGEETEQDRERRCWTGAIISRQLDGDLDGDGLMIRIYRKIAALFMPLSLGEVWRKPWSDEEPGLFPTHSTADTLATTLRFG